jgi:proteic killer suppression protein
MGGDEATPPRKRDPPPNQALQRTHFVRRRERSRAVPAALRRVALRKLVELDAAHTLDDLKVPPGNRLERLRGDRRDSGAFA